MIRHAGSPAITLIALIPLVLAIGACNNSNAGTGPSNEGVNVPWSRLSGRIVYSWFSALGGPTLYLADAASHTVREVTQDTNFTGFNGLAWASSSRVGYSLRVSETEDAVSTIDLSSGMTSRIAIGTNPTWSASGRVAWNCPGPFLCVDGHQLFGVPLNSSRAAWAPDNVHLVVAMMDATSQGSLYLVSTVDTTSRVPLHLAPAPDDTEAYADPVYSPDGTRIAFTRAVLPSLQLTIWVMRADGSGATELTAGPLDDQPAWSPDGKQIAYLRANQVFVMNADGTNLAQVTHNGANSVAWGP